MEIERIYKCWGDRGICNIGLGGMDAPSQAFVVDRAQDEKATG